MHTMNKTAESVWANCLSFIKDNIQEQAYKTWFEPIKAVELTDSALYIQVPSKFFYEWLEEHYVKLLKVALQKELGKSAKLLYKIKMENPYGINFHLLSKSQVLIELRLRLRKLMFLFNKRTQSLRTLLSFLVSAISK